MTCGSALGVTSFDIFQLGEVQFPAEPPSEQPIGTMGDVVETQREEYADTALALVNCYNNATKAAASTAYPIRSTCLLTISGGHWSRRLATRSTLAALRTD
jgi:hypothetical protein